MINKMLGIAPQKEPDMSYKPSKLAIKLSTSKVTNYSKPTSQEIDLHSKILVICTQEKNMEMKNGRLFSTGNHPVETLLPMLHLYHAGYDFEIATPTGEPVCLEMWAFPEDDCHVNKIYNRYKDKFISPQSLHDIAQHNSMNDYAAIFIPGGHGAALGLPHNADLKMVLLDALQTNTHIISLCHGPAALLSLAINENEYAFKNYNMAVFPDSTDNLLPFIGYLPGKMPLALNAKLKELGVNIVNTKADDTVCVDRLLITGASPLAADRLGKKAVSVLSFTKKG